MNFLRRGFDWAQTKRKNNATEEVIVLYNGDAYPFQATVTSNTTLIIDRGVQAQVHYMIFVFDRSEWTFDLRGPFEFEYQGIRYQPTRDKRGSWDFNDPYHLDLIFRTVRCT